MIWHLTNKISFGDWKSPYEFSGKSILCLSHYYNALDKPLGLTVQLDATMLYFSFPQDEEVKVNQDNLYMIEDFVTMVDDHHRFPLLVHCAAGQHRSPAVALYLALWDAGMTKENYLMLSRKLLDIRPEILWGEFGTSIDKTLLSYCSVPEVESIRHMKITV